MFTINEFTSEWKRLHHPTMSVDSDVTFYYQLYANLYHLIGQEACCFDNHTILPFLLHIENTIAVGLDGVYEYRYRSLGNVESRWCNEFDMSANADSKVHNLVGKAVADARYSALRQWMIESVLSGDFSRLSEMLTYFAREDKILQFVYPTLRYRKAMFMRLVGKRQTAENMLWADIAFNWRDKRGCSLADNITRQFRLSSSNIEETERVLLKDVAKYLDTIRSERLDTYTIVERKNECTFTLCHRDGRIFHDVIFPTPIPESIQNRSLAVQLVTYNGKNHINGPFVWLTDKNWTDWNGETVWNNILKQEQEAAKQVYFTTPFGKRISLYEDFYTIPEDPEEAYYADMGIYFDEPDILDFLGMLKPEK